MSFKSNLSTKFQDIFLGNDEAAGIFKESLENLKGIKKSKKGFKNLLDNSKDGFVRADDLHGQHNQGIIQNLHSQFYESKGIEKIGIWDMNAKQQEEMLSFAKKHDGVRFDESGENIKSVNSDLAKKGYKTGVNSARIDAGLNFLESGSEKQVASKMVLGAGLGVAATGATAYAGYKGTKAGYNALTD